MVCLDTSFIIDLMKNNPEAVLIKERLKKGSSAVAIASPTIIELIRGLNSINVKKNEREKIENFFSSTLTFPLDKPGAILAGNIELDLINRGEIIELEDIMIGAIVLQNNETLITKNKKHFERIKGLKVESY